MANDILQALNEIQAELAALTFDDGENPPSLPGETLVNIANNIEALRSTLETRSVAETVGQNTNFDDLIAALGLIKLICCPPSIYIGGTPTPDRPPSDPGIEFGTPPPNWEQTEQAPGTTAYYDRQCKVANGVHFSIRDYMQALNDNDVDDMTGVAAIVIATVVGAVLGELITPVPFLDGAAGGVIGFLAGLGLVIFKYMGQLEFGVLVTALNNNEQDLICALYEAPDSILAALDYLAVLENAGVSEANKAVVAAILAYDIINNLFFKSDEAIEAALDVYTPPWDCSGCATPSCNNIVPTYGQFISDDGQAIIVQSENLDGAHRVGVTFYSNPDGSPCDRDFTITPSVLDGAITNNSLSVDEVRIWSKDQHPVPSGAAGNLYSGAALPGAPVECAWAISIASGSAFTISVDYLWDNC